MKLSRMLVVFLLGFTLAFAAVANAEYTVRWDPNDPSPDGYALFARFDDAVYDYNAPFWEGPETTFKVVDQLPPLPLIMPATGLSATWDKAAGTVLVDWNQPAPLVNTHNVKLVVRAFIGTRGQADFMESADSEEVNIDQTNTNSVTQWEVFYSETSGGNYVSLGRVDAVDNTRITAPLTAVPVGQVKTIYFTVVTFGQAGTFSQNSEEVSALIDRRTVPQPPVGISVQVTVPVQ